MAVALEDNRIQIIKQLKTARGTARALYRRVDMVLASARLSTAAQGAFWESLNSDLAEESKRVLGKEAAAALSAVGAAAQIAVLKYRRRLGSDEAKSAD